MAAGNMLNLPMQLGQTGRFAFPILWLVLSIWFFYGQIDWLPMGVHSWAMADYYAMAIQYSRHLADIFHPRTFNLDTVDGITGSDLPVSSWLSGFGMRLMGCESPWVMRGLTWCAGLIGFVFYSRFLVTAGLEWARAAVVTAIIACLPVLCCYQNSMLPSPWALSAFMIGLFGLGAAVWQQASEIKNRNWAIAVGAFLLAALIRKPFVLYYAGLIVFLVGREQNRQKWIQWLLGGLVFVAWQGYDAYLQHTYGSIFLRHFMMADDFKEFATWAGMVWKKWGFSWVSPFHLGWLAVGIWLTALGWRQNKHQRISQPGMLFLGWSVAAGLVYFYLMILQFSDHEYYALDGFYPALLLGVALLASAFPKRHWVFLFELIILAGAIWNAHRLQLKNAATPSRAVQAQTNTMYREAGQLLDAMGAEKSTRVLVFEAYSHNLPLICMDHLGYCLKSSTPADLQLGLAQNPDFLVCLDTFFVSQVVRDFPEIVQKLERVGGSETIHIFKKVDLPSGTLASLLLKETELLCDSAAATTANEFIFGKNTAPNPGAQVIFSGRLASAEGRPLVATVSLYKAGKVVWIGEKNLLPGKMPETAIVNAQIRIPKLDADEQRLYLWNPEQKAVYFERFTVAMGQ